MKFDSNFFPCGRFPHPDKYLCEISRRFQILFRSTIAFGNKNILGGCGGHINTFQGGGTFHGKNYFNQTSLR